jgi:hypothetical protein
MEDLPGLCFTVGIPLQHKKKFMVVYNFGGHILPLMTFSIAAFNPHKPPADIAGFQCIQNCHKMSSQGPWLMIPCLLYQ